ncbi:MAG TPA: hypothetical protein VMK16_08515 [Acidimicrobiales bacterium]|nr:hypothetical protein [Acidimicrobiales bacterium]
MSTLIGTITANDTFAWVDGYDAGSVTLQGKELPDDLPLLLDHDEGLRIGTVELVARGRHGVVDIVASVDRGDIDRTRQYLSVVLSARRRTSLHHDRASQHGSE